AVRTEGNHAASGGREDFPAGRGLTQFQLVVTAGGKPSTVGTERDAPDPFIGLLSPGPEFLARFQRPGAHVPILTPTRDDSIVRVDRDAHNRRGGSSQFVSQRTGGGIEDTDDTFPEANGDPATIPA